MMAANDPQVPPFNPLMIPFFIQEMLKRSSWDPEFCLDWSEIKLKKNAILRIKKDVFNSKPPAPDGCYIAPHEDEFTKVHALIVGPEGTPYEGGFFHFLVRFPPDYPSSPPRVKLLTTDGQRVRFNPNLYAEGLVCISMLGTWEGPSWVPGQCLYTVLEAIQGVMNEKPYKNEPDLKKFGQKKGRSERYNEFLRHETLRVAVCGMIDRQNPNQIHKLPKSLQDKIKELFLENYDSYMKRVQDKTHLDGGTMMIDTYGRTGGRFAYKDIRPRLEAIHKQLSQSSPPEQS